MLIGAVVKTRCKIKVDTLVSSPSPCGEYIQGLLDPGWTGTNCSVQLDISLLTDDSTKILNEVEWKECYCPQTSSRKTTYSMMNANPIASSVLAQLLRVINHSLFTKTLIFPFYYYDFLRPLTLEIT